MGKALEMATVFMKIFILGLLLVSIIAGPVASDSDFQKPKIISSRRMLQTTSVGHPCGVGPVCLKNQTIKCDVGGSGGCVCPLVHCSHPDWSGCSFYNGTTVTPCGF